MNRETIIAILLGVSLGLAVGLVVLFKTSGDEETKVIPITRDNDEKVVTEDSKNNILTKNNLSIISPQDHSLAANKEVDIKGKANVGSLIIIQSPISQVVFKSEEEDFSAKLPLAIGENVISISAYSESSTPQENIIRIYYIPQE